MPFLTAQLMTIPEPEGYWRALEVMAAVGEQVMGNFFSATGAVLAVLVTFAVATGFGTRAHRLPARTNHIIVVAVVAGAFFIALMAAWTAPIAIVTPERIPSVVITVYVAWIAMLGAQVTLRVLSAKQKASLARSNWRAKRDRAAVWGIRLADPISRDRVRIARLVLWAVPILAWCGAVLVSCLIWGADHDGWWWVVSVGLLCGYGMSITGLGWLATADRSAPAISRIWARSAGALLGLVISVIFSVVLIDGGVVPLGVALIVSALAQTAIVILSMRRVDLPVLGLVERASTLRALDRARKHSKAMRARARKEYVVRA
ncbi:hypothetical protein [Microbacterium sp. Leaf320]|uniref:hypothetical protein n=1 Tax=Microbacterium sp. Leaf320 TaxID=1736334 RepID=UPI0012F98894|nr:hypothetical protein [Microbacterium sp. Leaf320]